MAAAAATTISQGVAAVVTLAKAASVGNKTTSLLFAIVTAIGPVLAADLFLQ